LPSFKSPGPNIPLIPLILPPNFRIFSKQLSHSVWRTGNATTELLNTELRTYKHCVFSRGNAIT